MNDSSIYILIGYTAIWFFLFFLHYKKSRVFGIASFVLLFYGVSALTSIYFYNNTYAIIRNIQFTPFAYIVFCLLLCLWPFMKHANAMGKIGLAIYNDNKKLIYHFLIISFPLLLWASVELAYNAMHTNTSALADIYNDRNIKLRTSFIGHICVGYMRLFDLIWPILFFYCISKGGRYTRLAYVAALGTLCMCIDGYIGASRAAIVRQIIYFVSVYFFCKNTLPKAFNRNFMLFGSATLGLFLIFLVVITVSRYNAGNGNIDILTWVSLYSGEGVLRFSEYAWDLDKVSYGDTNFSFIKSCLGLDTFTVNDMRREYYENKFQIPTSIFYTFIGDITMDFGKPLSLVFFGSISLMINSTIKKSISRGFYTYTSLYWLSVYTLMMIYGIMYFFCKTYLTEMRVFTNFILIWFMQKQLYRPTEQHGIIR